MFLNLPVFLFIKIGALVPVYVCVMCVYIYIYIYIYIYGSVNYEVGGKGGGGFFARGSIVSFATPMHNIRYAFVML